MRNSYIKLAALGLLFFGGAFSVSAQTFSSQTLYSQTAHNGITPYKVFDLGGGNIIWQQLGTGLSGTVTDVVVYVQASSTKTWNVGIHDCGLVSDCNPAAAGTEIGHGEFITDGLLTVYDVGLTLQADLLSNHYYELTIYPDDNLSGYYVTGATTNLYTGGDCQRYNFGSTAGCGIDDIYFKLNGDKSRNTLPKALLVNPPHNNATTTTSIAFKFNYSNATTDSTDEYFIAVRNLTDSTSFTLNGTISGATGSVVRTVQVDDNSVYSWSVGLLGSSGTTYYGDFQHVFSVDTDGTTASQQLLDQFYGSATTTDPDSGFLGINGLLSSLQSKIPFAYFFALITAWENVTADATSSVPTLALNFHDQGIGSTTPMGNFLPNVTFLSKDVIETYLSPTTLAIFFGIQTVSLYMGLGYYFYRRVPALFRNL